MVVTIIILTIIGVSIGIILGIYDAKISKQIHDKENIINHFENIIQSKKNELIRIDEQIFKNEQFILFQNTISDEIEDYTKELQQYYNQLQIQYQQCQEQNDAELAAYNQEVAQHKSAIEGAIQEIVKKHLTIEETLKQKIQGYEDKLKAYIEEQKRKEEMNTKLDFYKLKLSDSEISDVIRLMEISVSINQPDILKKLIYKTYFEKKMNDLLGRVVGANSEISAIYKITHIESQKSYIGQTTNVKERWRTHLKRGLGIDTPTTNKFYQSMIELKPWNFTWEILQTCSKEELNEKEKYWIEFFQTNSWGWNSKGGNK